MPVEPSGTYGVPTLGPTNYAVCVGTGASPGASPGSPWNSDGMFEAQNGFRLTDVTDGLSNTAMLSETTLGDGPENASGSSNPGGPQTVYAYAGFGTMLSDAACVPRASGTCRTTAASPGPPAKCAAPPTTTTTRPIPPPATASPTKGRTRRRPTSPTPSAPPAVITSAASTSASATAPSASSATASSLSAWRALATRATGDVVSDPSY